ncbi:hypothetical protein [Pseudomonas bohemica]|uniref:hypothetical protein n=1 Tax=Pseudomonas bohemica TaxID=2044872 RepID=UPI000DA600A3|nr:hypothetical protein [Pseudomonas bohemica]
MNTILSTVDAVLCALVVLAALEYLRRISPFEQPLLAVSFYLVTVSAFGLLGILLKGGVPSLFEVTLHAGVVLYAWARRHHIFEWNSEESRKAGQR